MHFDSNRNYFCSVSEHPGDETETDLYDADPVVDGTGVVENRCVLEQESCSPQSPGFED